LHKSVLLFALTRHYWSVTNKQVVAGVFYSHAFIVQYNTTTCEQIMQD